MATFPGRFLILTDTTSAWEATDPVLMDGELAVADNGSSAPTIKVGDGVRPWSALPEIAGSGGGGTGANYVVGTTNTLPPGSFASVTIDNTVDPPTISFGIPRGDVGPPNWLAIGTVTTGAPGDPAGATITGVAPAQTLNLLIPQGPIGPAGADGADGATGPTGAAGPAGPANVLTIGTVTTGTPGTPADATITGTTPSQTLNLTIPAGATGPMGPPGPAGSTANLANPTATIGLAVINGVSPDAMRSDAAPPLSQAIAPVWTGAHKFSAAADLAGPLKLNGVEGTAGQHLASQGAGLPAQWVTVPAGLAVADPTGTITLVPSNGVATTAMRSDAAPALSQAIVPTWTGAHKFSAQVDLSGPLKANGAEGTAGQVLASGGVGTAPSWASLPGAANPSASIGLTAVNGVASTYMRSDAAPQLSQAIAPTWSAAHNWGTIAPQSIARIGARGRLDAFEWGHGNTAGYGSTIGFSTTNGRPHIAFHAEVGTTANTFKTRGIVGRIITTDAAGAQVFGRAATANADDQALTVDATLAADGGLFMAGATGSSKGAGTVNATALYVNNVAVVAGSAALTKTDDTNVTLTLGGTPASALLAAVSLTLGWAGQLSVARGGTGAATLTGYVKGAGTAALTASATIPYADLTGTPSIPVGANPTASVGLTAVNGSAATFMRSDGAPALDQAIAPTWSGTHTFSAAPIVSMGAPEYRLIENDQIADEQAWRLRVQGKLLVLSAVQDSLVSQRNILAATRGTGIAIANVSFGNATDNNTFTFLGTGVTTFAGQILAAFGTAALPGVSFSGDPNTGFFDEGDRIGVAAGGVAKAWFTSVSEALGLAANDASGDVYIAFYESNARTTRKGYMGYGNVADDTFYVANEKNAGLIFQTNGSTRLTISGDGAQIIASPVYRGPSGTAAAPAYSFTADTTKGMFSYNADQLGFSVASALCARMRDVALDVYGTTVGGGAVNLSTPGASIRDFGFSTNSVPRWSIRCNGTAETGSAVGSDLQIVRRDDAGTSLGAWLSVTRATGAATFTGVAFIFDGVLSTTGQFRLAAGSASAPALAWTADPDTGLYNSSADSVAVACGGVAVVGWSKSGTTPVQQMQSPSAGVPYVIYSNRDDCYASLRGGNGSNFGHLQLFGSTFTNSAGAVIIDAGNPGTSGTNDGAIVFRVGAGPSTALKIAATQAATFNSSVTAASFQTTSRRAVKRETGRPSRAADILARLRPVLYRLLAGETREQLGLIAEEVREVCPQLSDGTSVAYDRLALLLLADWQEQRAAA